MQATSQEAAAARQLADALVEFIAVVDKASIERRANRLEGAELRRMRPPETTSKRAGDDTAQRRLLNLREAAAYLSISTRSLHGLTAPRGPLPVVKLRSSVRYDVDDLDAALADMKRRPQASTM